MVFTAIERYQRETPHMDRLAAEGVRCTDGYAAFPVCSPSRAAILTGRYPQRFGPTYEDYFGHGEPELDPVEHITIGQRMKDTGYRTGCFGKWNVSNKNRPPANRFGFDSWVGLHLNHDFYTHTLVANGGHDLFKDGKPDDSKGVWSDTIFADEAIKIRFSVGIFDDISLPELRDGERIFGLNPKTEVE